MNQWNRNRNNEKCQSNTITRITRLLLVFIIALFSALFLSQTASATDVNEEGKAAAKAELKLDEGQEYHAYIPKNDTIKFDNISVRIDGVDKGTVNGDDVYYDKDDIKDPGLITVEVFNAWHDECKNLSLTLPNDTVEIGFDVSGFQYDNSNASGQTDDGILDQGKNDSIDQKDTANQDNNETTMEERKDNKTLPITIAFIIMIVLAGGSIYLMMKRGKN